MSDRAFEGACARPRSIKGTERAVGVAHEAVKHITRVLELPRDLALVVDAVCDSPLVKAKPQARTGGVKGNNVAVGIP